MATINGTGGDDTTNGTTSNDSIAASNGLDTVQGDAGKDTINGGTGDDQLFGGIGNDSVFGGDGADTVFGKKGEDTLFGGTDDDMVSGHEGNNALHGSTGSDSLNGGPGGDCIHSGAENDLYFMGREDGGGDNDLSQTDRDVVRFEPGMGNDIAYDLQGENDFVYIGTTPEADIVATRTSATSWVLTISGNSSDSLTLNFVPGTEPGDERDLRNQLVTDAEYTVPENGNPGSFTPSCFTPDMQILTIHGLHRIGSLRRGDMVVTADHGPQKIRQIIEQRYDPGTLKRHPALRPVVIDPGSFGTGLPHRRIHVSRQHGFAALGGTALIRAAHLAEVCNVARVQKNRPNPIRYIQLVLDQHALVLVEGVWAETHFNNLEAPDTLPDAISPPTNKVLTHTMRCRPVLTRREVRHSADITCDLGQIFHPTARIVSDLVLEHRSLHA